MTKLLDESTSIGIVPTSKPTEVDGKKTVHRIRIQKLCRHKGFFGSASQEALIHTAILGPKISMIYGNRLAIPETS